MLILCDSLKIPNCVQTFMSSDSNEDFEIDMDKSILKLNDDCLFSVFSYLNIRELLVMEKVCIRFQSVAESIYKSYRVLDFDHLASDSPITDLEACDISARLGPYVHTLKASETLLSNRTLLSTLEHCNRLTSLHLEGFTIDSQLYITALAKIFPRIKTAQLKYCRLTDKIVMCLREAKQLETLDLSMNTEIVGDCLTVLRNIKDINLNYCLDLQVSYFGLYCEQNTALRFLDVSFYNFNHLCLEKICKHLKNLEKLKIGNDGNPLPQPPVHLVLEELPYLKHFEVNFNNSLNMDTFLVRLADRDILEFLDISGGYDLTRKTARALSMFTKLKMLNLNNRIECNDNILMQISSTDCLEELHIAGCSRITAEGLVAFIRKCPALKCINIVGCYCMTNDLIINILPHLDQRRDILEIIVIGAQISRLTESQIAEVNNHPKIKLNQNGFYHRDDK